MYIQIIKDIDNDRDMIEFVEDLSSYGVRISVKPANLPDGSILSMGRPYGEVSIRMSLDETRSLRDDLNRALDKYANEQKDQ